jgi:hypothetical protein
MLCREFESVFEQSEGAQLPAAAATHWKDCQACRAMAADFGAIRAAALELNQEFTEEPPAYIWLNLRAQLAAEGVIRQPETEGGIGWLAGLLGWTHRPALVATYAMLGVFAIAVIWQSPPEGVSMEASVLPAEALATQKDLGSFEMQAVSQLHPATSEVDASLRRNLDIVDKFIALCEKNVREEPQNEEARQYLYSAYQQKAKLLTTAMERDWTGE